MRLVLPVQVVAANACVLHVGQGDLHLGLASVASITPLPHLVEVGAQLALSVILEGTNKHLLTLKLVLAISTVLL